MEGYNADVACAMLAKVNDDNVVMARVEFRLRNRNAMLIHIDAANLSDFSRLQYIMVGVYQINLAPISVKCRTGISSSKSVLMISKRHHVSNKDSLYHY